jgi:hypothetical protein
MHTTSPVTRVKSKLPSNTWFVAGTVAAWCWGAAGGSARAKLLTSISVSPNLIPDDDARLIKSITFDSARVVSSRLCVFQASCPYQPLDVMTATPHPALDPSPILSRFGFQCLDFTLHSGLGVNI